MAELADTQIWQIAIDYVEPLRKKRCLARAQLVEADVTSVGLRLERDNDPPRHAAITDWPADKDVWKNLTQELAATASLKIR